MILYIITREENGHTAVWAPFEAQSMANDVLNTHVRWRVRGGDIFHREVFFTPDNKTVSTEKNISTLIPSCVVREVELIRREGGRTTYKITQHPLIEEQEQPFLLIRKKTVDPYPENISGTWY